MTAYPVPYRRRPSPTRANRVEFADRGITRMFGQYRARVWVPGWGYVYVGLFPSRIEARRERDKAERRLVAVVI